MAERQQPSPQRGPYSARFVAIAVLFAACLVTSNIIAVKIVDVAGLVLTAGVIIFPVSYIIGDVLTEVYGYKATRLVIWLGFFANLLFVAATALAGALPAPAFWDKQAAYDAILGSTPRILLASFSAFLVGEFLNAYVLAKMKIATEGRWLWTRTIGSTLVGQAADTTVFVTLAFAGAMPSAVIGEIILVQWAAKCLYEAAATPLTYIVVGYLKRVEGIDTYDRGTRFNPFALSN
ncbi:MAG: queuosine precursor transporter [Alphaproteobacteria bacterium]